MHLPSTDSTNRAAQRLAREGQAAPFWVTADAQTAARGRRGRAWSMGARSLACSAALRPGQSPAHAALRSFAAAVALVEALEMSGVAGGDLSLKWPNDVLFGGDKLAGILLESTQLDGALLLIVGIGVNLGERPAAEQLEPGALPPGYVTGVASGDLFARLAHRFDVWNTQLSTEGFEPLRAAWLARAARLGETITAKLPNCQLSGVFQTVDADGALVLDTANGRRHLAAADVFF